MEPLDDETLWGEPNKTAQQDEGAMTQEEIDQLEFDQRTAAALFTLLSYLEGE